MAENQIVLGYDLSREYIQISYMEIGSFKPETFSFRQESEQFNMPLCLCKRKGVNQWFVGEEAISCITSGDGIEVLNLYEKVMRNEMIVVDDMGDRQEHSAADLLGLFIKKSFAPMGFVLGGKQIEALMITVDTFDEVFLNVLKEAVSSLKLDKEHIYFQSHEESAFYYVIHQPRQFLAHEVSLFDFSDTYMKSYRIMMNRKTKPVVTKIRKTEHMKLRKPETHLSDMQKELYYGKLDEDFLAEITGFFEEVPITCVYLVGDGFHGDWYQKSLAFLCRNRKVFGGDNLYSRGATLAAGEKVCPSVGVAEYVLLGKEKLQANIGMELYNGDELVYEPILDAGTGWHEASYEKDFMLMEGSELELIITPVMGQAPRKIMMTFDELKNRPEGTIRMHIKAYMTAPSSVMVEVTDLGFGDFFVPVDKVWTKQILIGDTDE